MTRRIAGLVPRETADHILERRDLVSLIRFKLDVALDAHGLKKAEATALAAIGSAIRFLADKLDPAAAADLLGEDIAALRHRAERRALKGKGVAK